MSTTVKQPTANPTNKLTAAMVASVVMELSKLIVKNVWPQYYEEALWVALTPLAIVGAGYFIRDTANTPQSVVVSTPTAEPAGK